MKPIFLVGYMGTGKTTLGRALARHLGVAFYDLDSYIESRFHTTIERIFATEGEAAFRRRESAMLREVGEMENVVVACGGGTPCFNSNMEYMNSAGLTVLLEADHDCLFRRLRRNSSRRPLIQGLDDAALHRFIDSAIEARMPFYAMAAGRFRGENLENVAQIAGSVRQFVEKFSIPVPAGGSPGNP